MTYLCALRVRASHGPADSLRLSLAAVTIFTIGVTATAAADPGAEDPRDLAVIMPALNEALENERSGKDITWTNVATGRAGTIRIERTYYRGQQPCRDYTRTTVGNGPGHEVRGAGCRLGKLNWSVEETRKSESSAAAASAGAMPAAAPEPGPDAAGRSVDPSGEPTPPRPPRKLAPQTPPLRYGLPTRSQL